LRTPGAHFVRRAAKPLDVASTNLSPKIDALLLGAPRRPNRRRPTRR